MGFFMNSVLKKLSNKHVILIISFCVPFIAAPFLTPLSFRLTELFHQSERKMGPLIGALLVVEAVPYIY
jgi:hypothetical protein